MNKLTKAENILHTPLAKIKYIPYIVYDISLLPPVISNLPMQIIGMLRSSLHTALADSLCTGMSRQPLHVTLHVVWAGLTAA